jgi:hypothetical protein
VFVFDPTHAPKTAPLNKDGTRAPTATLVYHKDAIVSICLAPGPDPSSPRPRLVTASACNRIGIWDTSGEKGMWGHCALIGRMKTREFSLTSACALFSGVYQPGMTGVLVTSNTAEVRVCVCAHAWRPLPAAMCSAPPHACMHVPAVTAPPRADVRRCAGHKQHALRHRHGRQPAAARREEGRQALLRRVAPAAPRGALPR